MVDFETIFKLSNFFNEHQYYIQSSLPDYLCPAQIFSIFKFFPPRLHKKKPPSLSSLHYFEWLFYFRTAAKSATIRSIWMNIWTKSSKWYSLTLAAVILFSLRLIQIFVQCTSQFSYTSFHKGSVHRASWVNQLESSSTDYPTEMGSLN